VRSIYFALTVAVALCICAPASAASASPAPENPAVTKLARGEVDAWIAGKLDRTHYSTTTNAQLPDTLVTKLSGMLAPLGKVTHFAYSGTAQMSGIAVTQYTLTFENAVAMPNGATVRDFLESIALDQDGKITLIYFSPKPAL